MRIKSNPFRILESVIREHMKKHKDDDEDATTRAVLLPLAAGLRDERFARILLDLPLRHIIFLRVRLDLLNPPAAGCPVPKPQPPKRMPPGAAQAPLPVPDLD